MEKDQIKESIASLMKDRTKRDALAEMLVEYIQPKHITTDYISMLLNSRSLKPGDALVKKVRKGLTVRTLVPGAQHLKSELTVSERMNYVLDGAQVGVTANMWELESGELGTVESIKAEMSAKLRDYYLGKVFTALASIWNQANTPDNFAGDVGEVSKTALDDAIKTINETIPGGAKAIVGLRHLLTPITEFAAFWSDGTNTVGSQSKVDEVLNTGWIGKYLGVPILPLNQVYDSPDTMNPLLPTDRILVLGENIGEFITYGDVKSQQWDENRTIPPYWNFEIYQQFGMIIDNAQGVYVIRVI